MSLTVLARQLLARFTSVAKRRRPPVYLEVEELEQRQLMAAGLAAPMRFDFGTPLSPVAQGSIQTPLVQYSSARGWGWQSINGMKEMDRGVMPGANAYTRDLHLGTDGTFLVDLPDGVYDVKATLGDPKYVRDQMAVWLEGKQVASGLNHQPGGAFLEPTFRVTVTDGQLNVRVADQGGKTALFGLAGLEISPVTPVSETPKTDLFTPGSYITWASDKPLSSDLKNNPGVTGILLAVRWYELEGQGNNQFDWSKVDARIQEASAAGLEVFLKIVTGPAKAPSWLNNDPRVQKISIIDTNQYHSDYLQTTTAPVFWDPIFHAQRLELIRAAGKRYANNPTVTGYMTAFANWRTDDMNIPTFVGTLKNGQSVNQVQQWKNAGYTTAKMLAIGREILDVSAAAFPNQAIKLPIHGNNAALDGTSTTLARGILEYAFAQPYAKRFYAQLNFLNTTNPRASDADLTGLFKLLADYSPQIGFQMVSSATLMPNDGYRLTKGVQTPADVALKKAIDIALTYNPAFIEYWQVDGENTGLYGVMYYASKGMQQ